MSRLAIENVVYEGCHGVNAHEKHEKQPFCITVVLKLDLETPAQSDNVLDTLNYSDVRRLVKQIVETESYNLIETLAACILDALLQDARLKKAEVTIRKPHAWSDRNGVPSVTLTRRR